MTSFAIIGFGEVGERLTRDLDAAGATSIVAFDVDADACVRVVPSGRIGLAGTAAEAASKAEVVILSVTASSTLAAAGAVASGLPRNAFVLDLNSVSPDTKRAASEKVEAVGGRYVEAAVMTSISRRGLSSPMLLGGPHVGPFMSVMVPFGMNATAFSPTIGAAASVKMCRSVIVKGLEALVCESLLSARHFGVEEHVIASLADILPDQDWASLARYMIGRALIHGSRRSEEMLEAAQTVRQAGLEPLLSTAIAERQAWAGREGRALGPAVTDASVLGKLLDAVNARLSPPARKLRSSDGLGAAKGGDQKSPTPIPRRSHRSYRQTATDRGKDPNGLTDGQ